MLDNFYGFYHQCQCWLSRWRLARTILLRVFPTPRVRAFSATLPQVLRRLQQSATCHDLCCTIVPATCLSTQRGRVPTFHCHCLGKADGRRSIWTHERNPRITFTSRFRGRDDQRLETILWKHHALLHAASVSRLTLIGMICTWDFECMCMLFYVYQIGGYNNRERQW